MGLSSAHLEADDERYESLFIGFDVGSGLVLGTWIVGEFGSPLTGWKTKVCNCASFFASAISF